VQRDGEQTSELHRVKYCEIIVSRSERKVIKLITQLVLSHISVKLICLVKSAAVILRCQLDSSPLEQEDQRNQP